MLSRPPGDRYLAPVLPSVPPLDRPLMGRVLALGSIPVIGYVVLYAVLQGVLDLSAGLLAVSAGGGWLIGAAVRQGAWAGQVHRRSRRPQGAAIALAATAWVGGQVASWVVAMWILPGSTRTFEERLADSPFLDWLGPQLGLLEFLELALLVGLAWYGSRSSAVAPEA
jgi:hypothetical protein